MRKWAHTTIRTSLLTGILLATAVLPSFAEPELRQGLPGRRVSGGTRSECMAGSDPIVALSPESNLSTTTSNRPSVYFVIPETETAYPLEFSVKDSEGNRIYEKTLSTHEDTGLVEIQLPQALQTNHNYRWHLAIVCDTQDPFQNDFLSGWLRQISPEVTIENGPNTADGDSVSAQIELAGYYQENGLWNDAIGLFVSLRQQHPESQHVLASWNQLLQSLEIETAVATSVAMR